MRAHGLHLPHFNFHPTLPHFHPHVPDRQARAEIFHRMHVTEASVLALVVLIVAGLMVLMLSAVETSTQMLMAATPHLPY